MTTAVLEDLRNTGRLTDPGIFFHFHVYLERFIHFMHPFGYRLFGLYDFVRQVLRTQQQLNGVWFCNAALVAEVDNPRLRTDGKN